MKRLIKSVLLIFSLGSLMFFSCSGGEGNPLLKGNQNAVEITDAWITEVVDQNSNGFASSLKINFTIVSDAAINLYIQLGVRVHGSGSGYLLWDEGTVSHEGQNNYFFSGGIEGEDADCFDFIILAYDADGDEEDEALAQVSAESDNDLSDICMEQVVDDQSVQLIFNNQTHTPVEVNITGYGNLTVPANSSAVYNFIGNPGLVNFNASTQTFYNSTAVGSALNWTNRSVNMTGKISETYILYYDESIFFLKITNNGGTNLGSLYVNLDLNDEVFEDIIIPNDGIQKSLGYYNAHTNTEIWANLIGSENWAFWENISFPGGNNQIVPLTSSLSKISVKSGLVIENNNKSENYIIEVKN